MDGRFESWDMENSDTAEMRNNLTIVNEIVRGMDLKSNPEFHILGGAALLFYGLNYKTTLDIDTANKIENNIKEEVDVFINDGASEVAILPNRYKDRLVRIFDELSSIVVMLVSPEDILITKMLSRRQKDRHQIKSTGILSRVDKQLVDKIINEELELKYKPMALLAWESYK